MFQAHPQFIRVRRLEDQWTKLIGLYLPVAAPESNWRYSRQWQHDDPPQGWKLHITASVLTAGKVLARIGPFLSRRNVMFKAPRSVQELGRINSGLDYGFSQVGKCFTVYPKDSADAVKLACSLDRLTRKFNGPTVPYDAQYRPASSVYYRYGGFAPMKIAHRDGTQSYAIRGPRGRLVKDLRGPNSAVPQWLSNPFAKKESNHRVSSALSPLKSFLSYEAISQRGKGGVYRAIDVRSKTIRRCILKEGRRHGETDWDGRDGHWRVKHEARVLVALRANGIAVPEVYEKFELNQNFYLVMEYVAGGTLQNRLADRKMKTSEAIRLGRQLADLLAGIHQCGWAWRDCKPTNIIVTDEAKLVAIDFEGASKLDRPDRMPWGTPGYIPLRKLGADDSEEMFADDLYALGSVLHQLLTGKLPKLTDNKTAITNLSKRLPLPVREVVAELVQSRANSRPAAREVASVLESS